MKILSPDQFLSDGLLDVLVQHTKGQLNPPTSTDCGNELCDKRMFGLTFVFQRNVDSCFM